jgi:hypothetical protein
MNDSRYWSAGNPDVIKRPTNGGTAPWVWVMVETDGVGHAYMQVKNTIFPSSA